MTFRDYFHLFSTVSQQAESHDYFLHFIETPVPDLQRYP